MIPAAFDYQRPASLDEALTDPRAPTARGEGPRRRPEPAAAAQDAARLGGHARRHRPAARAQGRPADSTTVGSRSARSTTYAELLDSPVERATACSRDALAAHRRRPGPEPGHGRRARSPTPIRRRTCRPCLLALDCRDRAPLGHAASGRSPIDGFFEGAFPTGLDAGRDPRPRSGCPAPRDDAGSAYRIARAARLGLRDGRRRRGRVRRRRRRRSPRANVALTGVGGSRLPGAGRRGGPGRLRRLGGVDRGRRRARHRRRRRSTATSTPTATTGPRWPRSTPAARSRPPSLGCG